MTDLMEGMASSARKARLASGKDLVPIVHVIDAEGHHSIAQIFGPVGQFDMSMFTVDGQRAWLICEAAVSSVDQQTGALLERFDAIVVRDLVDTAARLVMRVDDGTVLA